MWVAVAACLACLVAPSRAESFGIDLYEPTTNNACGSNDTFTTVSFEWGCTTVGGEQVQFECTDDYKLRLVTGFSDSNCETESSGIDEIIERDCQQHFATSALYQLLTDEYNFNATSMPDSPCLTPFEQFEKNLGQELLDIFGLNNVTNATDPILYEVKDILFTYGIVFVCGMVLMGLLLCICGFKFFWLTLFLTGFAVCGYLGYVAWMQATLALDVDLNIIAEGILPTFLVCGCIGGILAWKFFKLGIFVLGACFGGALGYLLYMTVIQSFWSEEWGLYVIVGGLGLVFGIVFVFKHEFFKTVATAIIGAFTLTSGVSFLIGYYPSMTDIDTIQEDINAVQWEFWVFFGSFAVLVVLSIIVQQCIKKADERKKYQVHNQKCRTQGMELQRGI